MADQAKPTPPSKSDADQAKPLFKPDVGTARVGAKRVDLHNPTPARRVIHDGIENSQRQITVESGATVKNVELSDATIKMLRDRTKKRGTEKADLIVYPAGQAPNDDGTDADQGED